MSLRRCGRRNKAGGTFLNAICGNPAAEPRWLELVRSSPNESVDSLNRQTTPRNFKWRSIGLVMRTVCRLNISRSDLVMDLAHIERATPLHLAARQGNYKLVASLLQNGASGSLHLKNKMGCTPIDIARVCGPHHEVRWQRRGHPNDVSRWWW